MRNVLQMPFFNWRPHEIDFRVHRCLMIKAEAGGVSGSLWRFARPVLADTGAVATEESNPK
jgi:hypothetical protein